MGLLSLFKRFVDPEQHALEEAAKKSLREMPKRTAEGDPPPLACRICGHRGPDRFCPACLAETMEPVPPG